MTTANPDIRHALHARLGAHNRRIGVLRIAVPVAGCLVLALPLVQLGVSMVADAIPIAGIRLDADTLVIEAPRFEGRTATGTVYRMQAERSESRVGDLDVADLYGLGIDLFGGSDYRARVDFTTAQWTMSTEQLVSNEDVYFTDSSGIEGVMAGIDIDWPDQTLYSAGPVRFTFEGGSRLIADTMFHDMDAALWRFETVSLDMTPAPDAGQDRDPFAPSEDP